MVCIYSKPNVVKTAIVLVTILLFSHTTMGQIWSPPVNIIEKGINGYPDFCVDSFGTIHCVWPSGPVTFYTKICYSKSIDNGESWTEPISITPYTTKWLGDPHIASDTSGNLYVSYDYDVGGYIKICYVNFDRTNSVWQGQKEVGSGSRNLILIDHTNKVYFFWLYGTEYYRYIENNVLSERFTVSADSTERYYFESIAVDKQNLIYGVGNRTDGDYYRGAYITGQNNIWASYSDLSNKSLLEAGISLNSIGMPSFVWRQIMPDSLPNIRGTYYAKLENDSVSTPVFLAQNTAYPAIVVDRKDQPHIVESQKYDSGYKLFHRYILQGSWQNQILDSNLNEYGKSVLISKNSGVYLIYLKVDTTFFSIYSYNCIIAFRKYEIPPGIEDVNLNSRLSVFPNPFSESLTIELADPTPSAVNIKIFDLSGNVQYSEERTDIGQEIHEGVLKINISIGKQFQNGYYIVQISNGDKILNKSMLHINK
jgi:hypothetical protein